MSESRVLPDRTVSRPPLLFRPDPVIGWRLSPEYRVRVAFRDDVTQTINTDGWRTVPGAQKAGGKRLAIYGCSFTYGTGLRDEETFCGLLQYEASNVTILNRGIGGHGSVQNLLQFRRDVQRGAVDAAIFAIISDHRFRNIAHPQRMHFYNRPQWQKLGIEHVPIARMDAGGRAHIKYVPLWQPVINKANFSAFLPDDFMINSATLAVLQRISETASTAGVPARFVILDALDPEFNAAVIERFPTTMDVSTPYDGSHTFKPADPHPNVRANELFATRMRSLIPDLLAEISS